MNGKGPGDLIVARYRLDEPVMSDLAHATAWSAHDQILDRPVRVTFLGGPHVTEALDSARRAALVFDPRLTRVLDVGHDDGAAYVVTEPYSGATLSDVVAHGIVDPQQAQAVIGEAAAALEVARNRGVHHLALRPESIRIDGSHVLVTGLGLDAGIAGHDQQDAERTSRADAVGLVALLYYAMTARWAGPDLDVPWIAADAIHPLPAHRDANSVTSLSTIRPDAPETLTALCDETFADSDGSSSGWSTPAGRRGPESPADVVSALQPWGDVSVVAAIPSFMDQRPTAVGVNRQSVRAAFDAHAAAPPGTPPPAPPVHQASAGRIHRPNLGVTGIGVGTETLADTGGSAAPSVAEVPQHAPSYESVIAAAPAPPSESTRRAGGFNPTWIVLTIAVVGVVLGVIWAFNQAFKSFDPPLTEKEPTSSSQTTTGTATGTASPSAAPDVRPVIATGTQLDPQGAAAGDGAGEHPEAVALAHDGAPETMWFSRTYKTAQFGGLKTGIGYAITLQEKAPVSTIVLNTNNTGGHVELRATSPDKPTEGTVLASGALSPETELTLAAPTEGTSFVLWFTELPRDPEGNFRIELNEILVS